MTKPSMICPRCQKQLEWQDEWTNKKSILYNPNHETIENFYKCITCGTEVYTIDKVNL